MKISKILAVSALGLFLAACKIKVIVPEGGAVRTESGAIECAAGKTCNVNVTDIFFNEVFVAHPDDGMEFSGWKKRDRGFCGGSTEPCTLTTEASKMLLDATEKFNLSARAFHRIQRVARTIADLRAEDVIGKPAIAEAIGYRLAF